MRLAVWSPAPPASSGIADYVAEQLEPLARQHTVAWVSREPAGARPEVELDIYHVGNSPEHGFVYRAALERPGVVFLHDFCLHHLVLHETVERGDTSRYLREMRRAHGELGSFVGRQVARGLGGALLPSLYPLNDRVLEGALGVVGLSRSIATRAARRLPGRPVLHLPHHLSLPLDPPPTSDAARRALGLPQDALVITAPGYATSSKRLDVALRVAARLRSSRPELRLVIAGGVDPNLPLAQWARAAGLGEALVVSGRLSLEDFELQLAAADVVLSLRFPSHGEMSGALVRALGVGRPALVTAGTPAAEEFPEGVVVPVDPGRHEEAELEALLTALLADTGLRETIGRLARRHVLAHHGLAATTADLARFLEQVGAERRRLEARLAEDVGDEDSLLGYLVDEVRASARELGVPGLLLGLRPLLADLARGRE